MIKAVIATARMSYRYWIRSESLVTQKKVQPWEQRSRIYTRKKSNGR